MSAVLVNAFVVGYWAEDAGVSRAALRGTPYAAGNCDDYRAGQLQRRAERTAERESKPKRSAEAAMKRFLESIRDVEANGGLS